MGRELLISLGITILTAAALFLYFRNRFKLVEHKVNTIFQLVQSHSRGPRPVHAPPFSCHRTSISIICLHARWLVWPMLDQQ